jgi:hypothetical protein
MDAGQATTVPLLHTPHHSHIPLSAPLTLLAARGGELHAVKKYQLEKNVKASAKRKILNVSLDKL